MAYQLYSRYFHQGYQLHGHTIRQTFDKVAKEILECPEFIQFLQNTMIIIS